MQLYDPLARLYTEATHEQALQVLELCMQFFAAGTIADFEHIRQQVKQVNEQSPQLLDPLDFLYRSLADTSSERVTFLKAVKKWAEQRDCAARIVGITPASWNVSVHSDEGVQDMHVALVMDGDEDRAWARITIDADKTSILVSLLDGEEE